jgi:hypothetical protein
MSSAAANAQLLYAAPSQSMTSSAATDVEAQLVYAAPSQSVCTISGYRQYLMQDGLAVEEDEAAPHGRDVREALTSHATRGELSPALKLNPEVDARDPTVTRRGPLGPSPCRITAGLVGSARRDAGPRGGPNKNHAAARQRAKDQEANGANRSSAITKKSGYRWLQSQGKSENHTIPRGHPSDRRRGARPRAPCPTSARSGTRSP